MPARSFVLGLPDGNAAPAEAALGLALAEGQLLDSAGHEPAALAAREGVGRLLDKGTHLGTQFHRSASWLREADTVQHSVGYSITRVRLRRLSCPSTFRQGRRSSMSRIAPFAAARTSFTLRLMTRETCGYVRKRNSMTPLYEDPFFTFRFTEARIIPRIHLERDLAFEDVEALFLPADG